MKILHVCLANFYIDDMGYQENRLVRQNVDDGHEVRVLASTEVFDGRGGRRYTDPGTYLGSDGALITRIPYARWLPHRIARKLRIHSGVYDLISDFDPDSILFHGCAGNEIVTVARYARDHPRVLFYADSHQDFNNSARTTVSKHLLHRQFYRRWVMRSLPEIRKILCVNKDSMEFLAEFYGVPRDKLEFYPLGGSVLTADEISAHRSAARRELGLADGDFAFLQAGKMNSRKKLLDSLSAFSSLDGDHLRFFVVGQLGADIEAEARRQIDADPRIEFLGWKSTDELTALLCGVDAYVQPGTQSVSMQHALCCGCPVIIDDVLSHVPYVEAGATLVHDLPSLTDAMAGAPSWDQAEKQQQASSFAGAMLDYRELSKRYGHA